MARGWDDDRLLASAVADGVVVLAPGGEIVWANEAFAALLGWSLPDLIGTNGLDIVHPDELHRAADAILYAAQFPRRTTPTPYRLMASDGSWLDVELKSANVDREGQENLILVVRDGTARRAINRALKSVANGEALEQTAAVLLDAVTRRWPNTGAAISVQADDGRRTVIESALPQTLIEHAAGTLDHHIWGMPPDHLAPDGAVAVLDRTELAPALAEAAERAGFEGCAVAVVDDPGGDPAFLIVWFDHTIIARLEFLHAGTEIVELLGLALDRRHQLWQMWNVARHDSLTGLLNRAGFLEQFDTEVAATRLGPEQVVGVLYIDLDGLKAVNDRGGHAAGDDALVEVAARLRAAAGDTALVARLGGDEFVVSDRFGVDDPLAELERLATVIATTLAITDPVPGATGLEVTASVGLAIDDAAEPPRRTLERADAAMYRAKAGDRQGGDSRWSH